MTTTWASPCSTRSVVESLWRNGESARTKRRGFFWSGRRRKKKKSRSAGFFRFGGERARLKEASSFCFRVFSLFDSLSSPLSKTIKG